MQIEATLPIQITLQAGQWVTIREILTAGPFRSVAPLIASLDQQLEQAVNETAIVTPGNGQAQTRIMAPAHDPAGS